MIQEALTDSEVLKLMQDKYEDLRMHRNEVENVAFAARQNSPKERSLSKRDGSSTADPPDIIPVAGMITCAKCKRLGQGKLNCPNCYRCDGTNHKCFECPKSSAFSATTEETKVEQEPPVSNAEEPGQEPAAFASAHDLRAFAHVDLSNQYGESEVWYGDTGTSHHMTSSKREMYDFVPSKTGRIGTANSIAQ